MDAKVMKLARKIKGLIFHPKEVHVECLHCNNVFKKLIEFAKKNPNLYYMINCDYDYAKHRAGNFNMTRKQYFDIVRKRIKILDSIVFNIGLHPHLWVHYEEPLSYNMQCENIIKCHNFIRKSQDKLPSVFPIEEVSFGWWSWNKDTEKICNELGL